jgi:hypothetical protein
MGQLKRMHPKYTLDKTFLGDVHPRGCDPGTKFHAKVLRKDGDPRQRKIRGLVQD